MNSDNPLLVPVHLDCLMVNAAMAAEARQTMAFEVDQWSLSVSDYGKLSELENPWPALQQIGGVPELGVHLHWALPDALTRGQEEERGDGKVDFPHVPNRWLLVRSGRGAIKIPSGDMVPGTALPWKAWVIESDHFGDDGKSPYVRPDNHPEDPEPHPVGLGRTFQLHPELTEEELGRGLLQWDGDPTYDPGDDPKGFLKAIGPGDPTFAAWQPGVRDVFGLHDDLSDLQAQSDHLFLNYSVFGWFSDPRLDPLGGPDGQGISKDDFADLLARHKWALHGANNQPPPQAVLCHGTRINLAWQQKIAPARPNHDTSDWSTNIQVGVGNTAIDGLAAILDARVAPDGKTSHVPGRVAELFEAVQYHALQDLGTPGGDLRLAHHAHDSWFGAHPGGVHWDIIPVEREDADMAGPPEQVTADQVDWLADLNAKQREYDAEVRRLQGYQRDLYDRWWKLQRTANWPLEEVPEVQELFDELRDKTQSQFDRFKGPDGALFGSVPDLAAAYKLARSDAQKPEKVNKDRVADCVQAWLKKNAHHLSDTLVLKPSAAPRYWQPNNPVVVVTGLDRAFKHGEDGRHRDDDTLLCRRIDQAVTDVPGAVVNFAALNIVVPEGDSIPTCLAPLMIEAFLADPANANDIGVRTDQINAFQDAVLHKHDAAVLPVGTEAPSPLALSEWSQAWVPMFLEWEVRFYPTATAQTSFFTFDRDRWAFKTTSHTNVSKAGVDYRFAPERPDTPAALGMPVSMTGRTFLTPQAEYKFVEQISNYLDAHPPAGLDAGDVDIFLENLRGLDVLSQSLSGFHEGLMQRAVHPSIRPHGDVADLIGDQFHHALDPTRLRFDNPAAPQPFFNPVRGGFFHFTQLKMVDAFGQAVNLLHGNGNAQKDWQFFSPHFGRGMEPQHDMADPDPQVSPADGPGCLMELPPRILQPARLDFRLIRGDEDLDAFDDTTYTNQDEIGLAADANPVCGWVVPNHLDKALAVYDSGGNLLGELILRTIAKTEDDGYVVTASTVDWLPAPMARTKVAAPKDIPNQSLRNFIKNLQTFGGSSDANSPFRAFLDSIDATLWTVDPLGGRSDQDLSVLIGRPLALVRARLHFDLQGEPELDQNWGYDYLRVRPQHRVDKNGDPDPVAGAALLNAFQAGITKVEFEVKLGEPELRNDGLLGYFLGKDFKKFYSTHTTHVGGDHDFIQPVVEGSFIPLKFNRDECQVVTMLIDPRGAVHASTGLLPVKTLELQKRYVDNMLSGLRVTFRAGPILTDPDDVAFAKPAERHGSWAWLERAPTHELIEKPISRQGHEAKLPDEPPVLREGWLQLSEATPRLSYTVLLDPVGEGIDLVLRVTNTSGSDQEIAEFYFVVPLGTGPAALTDTLANAVATVAPKSLGWRATVGQSGAGESSDRVIVGINSGTFAADADPVEVRVAGINVNETPGTALIFVVENVRGQPTSSLTLARTAPKTAPA